MQKKIIFNIRFALDTAGGPWQIERAETLSTLRALPHSSNIFSSSTIDILLEPLPIMLGSTSLTPLYHGFAAWPRILAS